MTGVTFGQVGFQSRATFPTTPNPQPPPTNINFNFNVSFDGRWLPNGHLTVEFSVRWVNALASAVASITPSDATTTHSSRPSTSIQDQCCLRTSW